MYNTEIFVSGGVSYSFNIIGSMGNKARELKELYIGYFDGKAPSPLAAGELYCLKWIKYVDMNDIAPQNREVWDLIPFEGEHLCRILAQDDHTVRLCRSLKEGKDPVESIKGYKVIEPVYHVLHSEDFSSAGKLDILLQIISGLAELKSAENRSKLPGSPDITAHRDLKTGNVMVDFGGYDRCRVRIIDFASVKLESGAPLRSTVTGPMSWQNTTPEHVMSQFGEPDEHTDVFALGMMMAEFFGTVTNNRGLNYNPLYCWFENNITQGDDRDQYVPLYKRALACQEDPNLTWLEQLLEEDGVSLHFPEGEFGAQLKSLFRQATYLIPSRRIGFSEFKGRLETLKAMCSQDRGRFSIFMVDTKEYERHRDAYLAAASGVYLCGGGNILPRVFCYSSREELASTLKVVSRTVNGERLYELESMGLLSKCFNSIRGDMHAAGGDADSILSELEDVIAHPDFCGSIYIFTPRLEEDHGTDRLLNTLRDLEGVRVFAYDASVCAGESAVHDDWCVYRTLPQAIARSDEPAPTPDPEVKGAEENVVKDKGAIFFRDENGECVYVSKKLM